MEMKVEISKRGLPCVWESGGGWSNTGEAQIVCNRNGNKKKAIFERTRGDLACQQHALVHVEIGDFIIRVDRHRDNYKVVAMEIMSINGDVAECRQVRITAALYRAVEAAKMKSCVYHCREAVYIRRVSE